MDWIVASLLSAFIYGLYDLATKHAVRDNAVLPVLFWANVCSAVVWGLLLASASILPSALPAGLHVEPLTPFQHLQMLLKAGIVSASWICGYFAVKHLPLSLASPVRATSPIWTLLGAILILGERPSWLEGLGIMITLASFAGLSFAGRKEGIHFHRDKWIGFLIASTLLGAASGLYDKYLLGRLGYSVATVQCWFSIYLALLFLPVVLGWYFRLWQRNVFHWRWSILLVSAGLLVADFLYFGALRDEEALISIVYSLRRASILVAFGGGILLFKEQNGRQKLPAVIGIVTGIVLTLMG
ncbi:DMT family transporter [Opitutaceae bacterium]